MPTSILIQPADFPSYCLCIVSFIQVFEH